MKKRSRKRIGKNRNRFKVILYLIIAVSVIFIAKRFFFSSSIDNAEPISYADFIQLIEDDLVKNIVIIDSNTAEFTVKSSELYYDKSSNVIKCISVDDLKNVTIDQNWTQVPSTTILSATILDTTIFEEFVHDRILSGQEIQIEVQESSDTLFDLLMVILFLSMILSVVFPIFMTLKKQYNITFIDSLNSKNNKYLERPHKSNVRASDIAGMQEEKTEVFEIADFLISPEKYRALGAKLPKGVLLTGAPGTGKTLIAKAIAGEANVNFIPISGSEFDEKYVGVGASRVRELFSSAKKNAPCIIFIDEIDAVGGKRSEDGSDSSGRNQTLDQLLIEMDGFNSSSQIIVIGATNRPQALDKALLRPGRFDRTISIKLPDVKDREEILILHSKNKPFFDNVNLRQLAYNTPGYSGAELENLLNEAAILAARKGQKAIFNEDIYEAQKKITVGLQKKNRVVSENERRITAYHEAGHTVVSLFTKTQSSIKEVSIIPQGDAGGYTWREIVEDRSFLSKTEIKERLQVLLAGRVAEKLVIGDISTGASNDIEMATKLAREMISKYGMDEKIGCINLYGENHDDSEFLGSEILNLINKRIVEILQEEENNAKKILTTNITFLNAVAESLLKNETLTGEDLKELYKVYQEDLDS